MGTVRRPSSRGSLSSALRESVLCLEELRFWVSLSFLVLPGGTGSAPSFLLPRRLPALLRLGNPDIGFVMVLLSMAVLNQSIFFYVVRLGGEHWGA